MQVNNAVPWQNQLAAKQAAKQKLSWQSEGLDKPTAWQKNTALPKPAWQQGLAMQGFSQNWFSDLGDVSGLSNDKETRAEQIGQRVGQIMEKMRRGQALTDKEMKLLAKHSPTEYQKAKMIQEERESYRKELENCHSKEEVEKVKERKMMKFSAEIKAIQESSMSKGDKMKAIDLIGVRMRNVENEHNLFRNTPEYRRLPAKKPEEDRAAPVVRDKNEKKKNDAFVAEVPGDKQETENPLAPPQEPAAAAPTEAVPVPQPENPGANSAIPNFSVNA